MNYRIISNQIGRGILGKVYQIMEIQPPHNLLIAKIFYADNIVQYNNEKSILDSLSSNNTYNNYIIKIKNMDINLEGDIPFNAEIILFDYLQYGNLSKYLLNMDLYTPISQDYIKIICLKLLKAIKVIHNNDISHNNIDLINIMFDNEFNPIIIHFTDAKRDNNNNFREDFKGLGKTLAKLMTNGKFLNFEYYEKKNCYAITDNFKKKYRDKKFWSLYEDIPKEFIDFFNILMKERQINIDDLLNNKWLNSITKADDEKFKKIENNHKKYFLERYKVLKDNENSEKEEIDINSMINTTNNNSYNLSSLLDSCRSIETSKINNISKLKIKEIDNEPKGIVFDYIEITINLEDVIATSNFFYNYMLKLEEIIQNEDKSKITINYDEKYLAFSINVKTYDKKENDIIDDEINNNEEKQDYNNINNNNNIYEDENNEDEYLEIKIELFKYDQITNCYKEKYYLMFNYIEGEIYDYYHYLKIIKEKAKNLLKKKCFN